MLFPLPFARGQIPWGAKSDEHFEWVTLPTNMELQKGPFQEESSLYKGLCTSMLAGGRVNGNPTTKPTKKGKKLRNGWEPPRAENAKTELSLDRNFFEYIPLGVGPRCMVLCHSVFL